MQHLATVWICTDCTLAEEGYGEHELGRPIPEIAAGTWFADEYRVGRRVTSITRGMLWHEHATDCPNYVPEGEPVPDSHPWGATDEGECECEQDDYVMHACERCGDRLAGYRHAYTVWGDGTA